MNNRFDNDYLESLEGLEEAEYKCLLLTLGLILLIIVSVVVYLVWF